MRVMLIVNPTATAVTPRRVGEVLHVLGRRHEVTVAETSERGDAARIARASADSGSSGIIVLGGDGTLNEAANGIVGSKVVLAPLPGGSTNVFARNIGLPRRILDAAGSVSDALSAGRSQRIGVGRVQADDRDPRVFVCHLGIGWDASLVAEVERHRRLERRATVALYTWAGLRTFVGYGDRRRPRLVASSGDEHVSGCFTLVQNSDPYTYVGPLPLRVAPSADRHGGLAATTLATLTAPVLLRALAAAATGRGVRAGPSIRVSSDLDSITVRSRGAGDDDDPLPYQIDGDHMGDARIIAIDRVSDALRVIDPTSR